MDAHLAKRELHGEVAVEVEERHGLAVVQHLDGGRLDGGGLLRRGQNLNRRDKRCCHKELPLCRYRYAAKRETEWSDPAETHLHVGRGENADPAVMLSVVPVGVHLSVDVDDVPFLQGQLPGRTRRETHTETCKE